MTSVPDAAAAAARPARRTHDARAGAHRRVAHEHRRAGHPGAAADHQHAADRPLVGGRVARRAATPRRPTASVIAGARPVAEVDADVGDVTSPACVAAGLEHEPGLGRRERDGAIGADRRRLGPRRSSPSTPDGMSTATHGHRRRRRDRCDDPRGVAVERAAEPGAEHRVDDDVGAVERADEPRRGRRRRRARTTSTRTPQARSASAATRPSPPLLPLPQTITTAAAVGTAARVADRPRDRAPGARPSARRSGVPAAIVRASASPISAGVTSGITSAPQRHRDGASP